MTPFLIFLACRGVAVGTGARQVVAASVSSALGHWQRGNVDLQMGYLMVGGGCRRRCRRQGAYSQKGAA